MSFSFTQRGQKTVLHVMSCWQTNVRVVVLVVAAVNRRSCIVMVTSLNHLKLLGVLIDLFALPLLHLLDCGP